MKASFRDFATNIVALVLLLPVAYSFTIHHDQRHLHRQSLSFSQCGGQKFLVSTLSSNIVTPKVSSPSSFALHESPKDSNNGDEDMFVDADDFPGIQALFNKFCDKDGLMTKTQLMKMSPFSEMLEDGDLQMDELEDIWKAAPKFPDVVGREEPRIDVDSFVQIYRDVDDLFEDEEGDEDNDKNGSASNTSDDELNDDSEEVGDDDENDEDETFEAELERIFSTLCDKDGLLSKTALKGWEEIVKLTQEGLVGEDEVDEIWEKTPKIPGSNDQLDVDGFLSFNVALDGLFEFEDDEDDIEQGSDDSEEHDLSDENKMAMTKPVIEGDDLPPGVLFAAIADEDYLVGMDELKRWGSLQDMIEDGDLLPSELQTMYDGIESTESGKLNEEGFIKLYEEIEALFEDVGDDSDDKGDQKTTKPAPDTRVKDDLLSFIDLFINEDKEQLPCGLDASEKDQKQIMSIVSALEQQPSNLVRQKDSNIEMKDLAGTWELLYSSSSAMKFNKGLTGLGGSFPNGKFAGLKQTLTASKFLNDFEYVERVEVNPSSASFDVNVSGSWDLRTSVSLFTGLPTIVVAVEPDRVKYGPTSTRADHWKSLGPMNLLDLTYLDDDLRVMRGCTSSDTIFILKRVP